MRLSKRPFGAFRLVPFALAIIAAVALSSPSTLDAREKRKRCPDAEHIEGVYDCSGECVLRDEGGGTRLVEISGEVDTISRIEGSKTGLYQSNITGAGGFSEQEIGALSGRVMRTATARVSDGQFPVLEEYLFETDATCGATGYTKIVRNPTQEQFKACNIHCEKQAQAPAAE
jgi:hypothetical protein